MIDGSIEKLWSRVQNITRRVTLKAVDDTGNCQTYQTEGFPGEIRPDIARVQEFGFASVPLPGSEGITVSANGGYHGVGAFKNNNDYRYRVKNQKPGEVAVYIADGADKKTGDNGKVRTILKGAVDWITSLLGKTIKVGQAEGNDDDTVTITVKGKNITITGGENFNLTAPDGDITIHGISLRHHKHTGVQPGSGQTGEPV